MANQDQVWEISVAQSDKGGRLEADGDCIRASSFSTDRLPLPGLSR